MSSSAPPPSSASSSTAPSAAASAAASSLVVAYELRDEVRRNEVLASDSLPCGQMVSVADLRRAVFAANEKKLRGRDYTDLDVYPPGSNDDVLADHSRAARPRDSIAIVLAKATAAAGDDTLIIIARPLPAAAGGQGQQHRQREQSACWSASTLSLPLFLRSFPCPRCLLSCVSVCVCSAASPSALPARQIEELTSAIIAGLSARQEETIAGLKADLEEKLDTVEELQEETRNAVRELQARQGQTADSPPSHPHAAALALPPLTSAVPLALLLCMCCAV